ncbi:MAG: hypothetical protein LBP51_04180 [Deferribacteraceae bacterium]|jgi:hypothetical protein|nr:hypothetical protein [Deferribacteraceae bacterium]
MLDIPMLNKLSAVIKYNLVFLAFLAIFSLLSTACAVSKTDAIVNNKPAWFWEPNDGELIGGVGDAGTHVDGIAAQRQLAVYRAIEDIARQKGVTVNSVQTLQQYSTETSSSSSLELYSVQTVSGATVTARVREFWIDPQTKRLLVWVTEVK